MTCSMVVPSIEGDLLMVHPAAVSADILDLASPFTPEMTAPAWPKMRGAHHETWQNYIGRK